MSLGSHSDIVRFFIVIVIFYCANTTALHTSDWKFSEGGRWVKLGCKMGRAGKRLKTTGLEVLRIFTRKMLVSQLNIRGVCRCHAFNKLVLTYKNFNSFVRYKTIPTLLCKDRR